MLMPKRTKYRKQQRGRRRGKARRGNTLDFGSYGLQAREAAWLTGNQLESARVAITRHVKRTGKLWIRVFPDKPVSKKPLEVRMGKGKGAVDHWVAVVKPGRVMFEVGGVPDDVAREALRRASYKLPVKTKVIPRIDPITGR